MKNSPFSFLKVFGGAEVVRGMLARAVHDARLSNHLTREELASLAGVKDPSILDTIEQAQPTNDNISVMATLTFLGIPIDMILPFKGLSDEDRIAWEESAFYRQAGGVTSVGPLGEFNSEVSETLALQLGALNELFGRSIPPQFGGPLAS